MQFDMGRLPSNGPPLLPFNANSRHSSADSLTAPCLSLNSGPPLAPHASPRHRLRAGHRPKLLCIH